MTALISDGFAARVLPRVAGLPGRLSTDPEVLLGAHIIGREGDLWVAFEGYPDTDDDGVETFHRFVVVATSPEARFAALNVRWTRALFAGG